MQTQKWYTQTNEDLYKDFQTSPAGLSPAEADRRLKEYGLNQLPEKKPDSLFQIFLRQFKSPLIYVLVVAAIFVVAIGDTGDALVIVMLLLLNSVVGTIQEGRTQNTLEALKKFVQTQALVRRSDEEELIADSFVVPGDIVILREGDKVPADGRVIKTAGMKVDESSLTGESVPVEKNDAVLAYSIAGPKLDPAEQKNMVFKGTLLVSGQCEMLVVGTGLDTEIGKISESVAGEEKVIPLKKNIQYLSKLIVFAVLSVNLLLFVIGLAQGKNLPEMIKTVVALSVSLIPEGLPVILTLVLANGVWRMTKRNALVKKLAAVEGLGQTDIIAVDKTGTITMNQLVVRKVIMAGKTFEVTGSGFNPDGKISYQGKPADVIAHPELSFIAKIGAVSAASLRYAQDKHQWLISGDPTEGAMVVLAEKAGFKAQEFKRSHPILQESPFDYKLKYRAVVFKDGSKNILVITGAPEMVGKLSGVSEGVIRAQIEPLTAEALRLVAFAFTEVTGSVDFQALPKLTFGGYFAMRDTLHPEVPGAVADLRSAGIKTVMITGDHKLTAQAIAKLAGIYRDGDLVVTGREFDDMSHQDFINLKDKIAVFARVTPEHKLQIVKAYQNQGSIIAMTGDGVNDVPSLSAANLGIAMGVSGTEVTKEASDIVLLDDNFKTIASAVEEGRGIYNTIHRVVLYLFATSLGNLLIVSVAVVLGWMIPILPTQILWLNFVTDGVLTVTFAFDKPERNLLRKKFEKSNKFFLTRSSLFRLILMSSTMMVGTLILFALYLPMGYAKAVTVSLTVMAVFQWFNAWNNKSAEQSVFKNLFSNKFLVIMTGVVIALQILAVYWGPMQRILRTVPLNSFDWLIIVGVATSILVVEEFRKWISRHAKHPRYGKSVFAKAKTN